MHKAIIFLSFTTSQNQSIQNCINYFKYNNKKVNEFYFISNTKSSLKHIKKYNQLQLTKITSWNDGMSQILFKKNKKDLQKFIASIHEHDQIEIIIPHFQNILCNYFVNHCKNYLKSKNIIISLYPDGMLSYQPYEIKNRFEYESVLRWIGGLFTGMKYEIFKGPIADPYKCIEKIYTYIPSITIPYTSNEIIKIHFSERRLIGKNTLILGHYKQSKFDKIYLKKINHMISGFLAKTKDDKIYYKPHPRINEISKDIFYKSILKIPGIEIVLCINEEPVEQLVESIGASKIIASVSTSMINLKLKYRKQISCYYFGLNDYVLPQYSQYYQRVFQKLSIRPLIENYE